MASERAKELAAKQKAEKKALKEAKKNSTIPKDWGTIRQIRETLKITIQADKPSLYWLLGALIVPIIVLIVVGFILNGATWGVIWWVVIGIMAGLVAAMWTLTWRAKKAMFKRYEGQPGAGQVGLSMLNEKKWFTEPSISGNRQGDTVHRTVGPGGLILVGDGDANRVKSLLNSERKRHENITYDVEVITISAGDGEGQIPINKLADHIKHLPKKLDKVQISEVRSRLKALDNIRGKVPLPKGPMPSMKGVHRAMRGR
jgi:hypothetical protein